MVSFDIMAGQVCYRDFGPAAGSQPAHRRPVVIVQTDKLNRSELNTVLVVPLTSNLSRSAYSGSVTIPKELSGLPKDSVALPFQVTAVNKSSLEYPEGIVPTHMLRQIIDGIHGVLA